MRAVVQRVRDARVDVAGRTVGAIGTGLLVYLGVGHQDTPETCTYMAGKVVNLRIFPDDGGRMNLSLQDLRAAHAEGAAEDPRPGILVISQFTLFGDVTKGRRPSYNGAAPPEKARVLYREFLGALAGLGIKPQAGVFQEHMDVRYTNDGPVTILIDTETQAATGGTAATPAQPN